MVLEEVGRQINQCNRKPKNRLKKKVCVAKKSSKRNPLGEKCSVSGLYQYQYSGGDSVL